MAIGRDIGCLTSDGELLLLEREPAEVRLDGVARDDFTASEEGSSLKAMKSFLLPHFSYSIHLCQTSSQRAILRDMHVQPVEAFSIGIISILKPK